MARRSSRRATPTGAAVPVAVAHANAALAGTAGSFLPVGLQRTSTGASIVSLRQEHAGIPVLGGVRTVRLDADGKVLAFTGKTIRVPPDTPTSPAFGAPGAVQEAFVALLGEDAVPPHLTFSAAPAEVVAAVPHPSLATVLRKAPFVEPILAWLVIDASAAKGRLLWEVRLGLPDGAGSWLVRTTTTGAGKRPRVVEVLRASSHAIRGDVYEFDPRDPVQLDRPFPRPRDFYPPFGGAPIPLPDWVGGDLTDGNNTRVVSNTGSPVRAVSVGADLTFKPDPHGTRDHCATNAFYWCNVMHDFFLLLGFDEAAGNFQHRHASGAGGFGDALSVLVRDQMLLGIAFYEHRPDGTSPKIEMGSFADRHSALDVDLIIHEFVHGVINRVVGGQLTPTPLTQQQSVALAEGFCDYYAITIQNFYRRREGRAEDWIFGEYIASSATGLRSRSYDGYPNTYGFLKKPNMKAHHAGEVWCAALLDLNAALSPAGDRDKGDELGWQLVFNVIRALHPAEPNFLHARDVVLQEFDAMVAAGALPADPALRSAVVDVFRRRGMGKKAKSKDSKFKSAVEDFT
jgi:extracellular elastinolytic metalloproteinase